VKTPAVDINLHFGKGTIMDIKVLGSCCGNCNATADLIDKIAQATGVSIQLEKVQDVREVASYGVISTPGVVIDGKVVHVGSVPSREKIEQWLAGA
jgi:small redox-active disulfide protein 2